MKHIKQIIKSEETRKVTMKVKNLIRKENDETELFDSDENFSFIAGYTSGGAPFGISWDEEELEDNDILLFWQKRWVFQVTNAFCPQFASDGRFDFAYSLFLMYN